MISRISIEVTEGRPRYALLIDDEPADAEPFATIADALAFASRICPECCGLDEHCDGCSLDPDAPKAIEIYEIRQLTIFAHSSDEAMAIYEDKGEDAIVSTRRLEIHPERPVAL